jgi:hypothetical protein
MKSESFAQGREGYRLMRAAATHFGIADAKRLLVSDICEAQLL